TRAIDHLRARGQNRHMDPLEAAAELADDKPTADATCKVRRIRRGCNAALTALPATSARRCAARSSSALKHHEKLDPAGDDQIEGLSGAMTDVDNHEQVSPNELLAADYALGVLAGTERPAAAQRLTRDRA